MVVPRAGMAWPLPYQDQEVPTLVNSAAMINNCFRHQHPEAYGDQEVAEPHIPAYLRYGHDRLPSSSAEQLPEETVGNPAATPLD